jgi:O-antigen/teichoic acid export membrane protein
MMAEYQHNTPGLLACIDRCQARIGVVVFPICAVMALAMVPLVALLLGPVWAEAGQAAQLLVGLMAYVLLSFPGGIAGVARGQPKYALQTNVAALVATLAGAAVLQPATPLQAVAIWVGAQALTSPYGLAMNARLVNAGLLRPLRAGLPSLAVSIVAVIVGFSVPGLLGSPPGHGWLIAERLLAGSLVVLPFVMPMKLRPVL